MRRFGLLVWVLGTWVAQAQQPASTTLMLTSDAGAPAVRQVVHLSAALGGALNATGTVTFSDGAKVIATVPVNSQGATWLGVASFTQGTHDLSAAYSGDSANAGSSGSLRLVVSGLPAPFSVSASPASLYANSASVLTALGLPANATGSISFSDGATTLATVPITDVSTPTYQAFGDSITAGATVSDPAQHYVNEVAAAEGFAFVNEGVAGSIACDLLPLEMLANGFGPTQASSPLTSVMIGTDDVELQSNEAYEPVLEQCHQADLAWLAIPREYKILPGDGGVSVLSGTWEVDSSFDLTTYGTLFNSSGAGTARFSITTTGAPIYLWYLMGDQLSGSFTITIDGTPTGVTYTTQPAAPIGSKITANPTSIGYALLRLPAAQGPHSVDIAVQSGSVGILAVATPPSPGSASVHPTVLATDIPNQLSSNPAAPAATIEAYTQDIESDIALLAGDGLDVRLVPTQPFMLGLPAEMSDPINPNSLGQMHLAQAFASVLANVPTAPFAAFSNTAPAASVSFANPVAHTITASYSGDGIYAASSASATVNVLAQAATGTTLSAPVTHAYFGTAVSFTATVTPENATGSVTFYDGTHLLGQAPLTSGTAVYTSSNLAVGIHNLSASYNGDAADMASGSPQLAVEIVPTPTTLTLAPLPSTATYGPATTLRVSIQPASATGTVTFYDGATTLGSATLIGGAAAVSTSFAVGAHTITASYSGDASDLPTSSAAQTITIQPIATTTTIAALPATTAYGNVVALVATVAPSSAIGTVSFVDNASGSIAQATLNNGVANASINTLTVGSHNITAVYAGDGTHAQSSSQPATTQVVPAPTTTALAAIPGTIDGGTPLTLNAQVAPASATGTVVFRDAVAGTLGQSPVVRGSATLTLNSPAAAAYSITAQYSGDSLNAASASAAVPTQVILAPTTTSLAAPATAPYGSTVTLSVNVVPATASGVVQFSDGAGVISTALLANGSASTQLSTLSTGTHVIHASYLGDTLNAASTSAIGTTIITADPTTTTLALAEINVPAGGLVTFNIAVSNSLGSNPTGIVAIRSGSTTLAQAPLTNGSGGSAFATLSVHASALGSVTAAASYAGDTNDLVSSSAPVTYTVVATPTVAMLSLSAIAVPISSPVTLTAIVASANAVPSGSVVFASNGITIASIALNSVGQASTALASLPAGVYAISASFVPSGLFAAAKADAQTLTVTLPVALTVNPGSMSATPGSAESATLSILPLSNFSGAIAAQCQTPAAWLSCSVSAPASVNASPVAAPIRIRLQSSTAAILPFAILLLGPLILSRRRRRLLTLALSAAILSATACTQGGTFFDLPDGPQQLTLAVTAAGVTITAPLTVNISQ